MTKTNHYLNVLAALMTLVMLGALTATVTSTPVEAATKARTTLTIQAEGVDLSGKVKSSKLGCLGNRTVKVYKQKGTQQSPSTDPVIASDISERVGDHGEWSVGNTGMEGKFYARTRGTLACTGATSTTIVAQR
jgi:hypothetical protein